MTRVPASPHRSLLRVCVALAAGALWLGGCASAAGGDGWTPLLAGGSLDQWRGYRMDHVPSSWRLQDGVLAFVPGGERGDLVTRRPYGDFELEMDWKIGEGGNSGVMYRVGEDEQYPWQTGPEMQVLDNERHADGKLPSHRAGALYDLVVPPEGIVRPVGEWNHARIRVQGGHIQQWLNGHPTADIVVGSDEWNRRLAESKFKAMPRFARLPSGLVALQDHGDPVWFRDIRIRALDGR